MLHVKRNVLIFVKNLGKILIYVIHHKEDARGLFPALDLWDDDVKELDSKDVILHGGKATENRDLSINSLRTVDTLEGILNVFDGHHFFCLFLCCFYYLSETSLALYLMEFVVVAEALPHLRQVTHDIVCFLSLLHCKGAVYLLRFIFIILVL